MRVFEALEPKEVFSYFEDICRIPHGSDNIRQISDYCVSFAREHHLEYRQEECGNVIIKKPAAPGYENAPTVILQGHMDMVAVKDEDCTLELDRDGLEPAIDGDWVYAKGTSLGGDDGIALAYAMAILADDTIPHPALEAVFTVNEEIGLLGAAALDASDLKGTILMNMDSEDDGIFLIGCAGGATVECRIPAPVCEQKGAVYELRITGLTGGHSGTEIIRERANAIVLLGRFLVELSGQVTLHAGRIAGGEKDNAIAKRSSALLVVPEDQTAAFEAAAAALEETVKREYALTDPELSICAVKTEASSAEVLTEDALLKLSFLLTQFPAGIQRRMPDLPELVQTSLNLGVLRLEDGEASMTFSVRSSVMSERDWLMKKLQRLTAHVGGVCRFSGVYPAWEYRKESLIRSLMAETYEELTGRAPVLEAIHAGVECGIFCEKLPGIDCISYGPQMQDIHTTRERLCISSVKRNYELTLAVLKKIH